MSDPAAPGTSDTPEPAHPGAEVQGLWRAPQPLRFIETAFRAVAQAIAWLAVLLVLLIVFTVVLRYVFSYSQTWLSELRVWLFATLFLVGFSYTTLCDSHVRMDLISQRFPAWVRRWGEVAGLVCLQIPVLVVVTLKAHQLFAQSYSINESSSNQGGMPWLWLLLAIMTAAMGLWLLASVLRLALICCGKPVPDERP